MKKMMTYLLISIVAIIAIVLIFGLFLPKERTFTKTAVLNSDVPPQIWKKDKKVVNLHYQTTENGKFNKYFRH
jgi:hypothetical protein